MDFNSLIALALGYLLGSIPFGLLLVRMLGLGDIRDIGSGNIGATNAVRAGGRKIGALVLLLDMAKGAVAVLAARTLFASDIALIYAGFGAIIGHLYPVWLKFKGGKGVATFLGVLLALLPVAALLFILVWLAAFALTRISSVGGLLASFSAPVTAWFAGASQFVALLLGIALLIAWKHRANISRLMRGEEPRSGAGAKTAQDTSSQT